MLKNLNDKYVNNLVKAILSVQSEDECYALLEGLCSITEIKSMAQRLEVARMLQNNAMYTEIVSSTGASAATVSRVNRALNYDDIDYKSVIDKLYMQCNTK